MKYTDSDVGVAKAAFAFLLDSYLATHCQYPAGDYLRVLVANRMEGRNGSAQAPEAQTQLAPAPLPQLPAETPERDSVPDPKMGQGWTPERRAKYAATLAAKKAGVSR